jgi:hypothetical protein
VERNGVSACVVVPDDGESVVVCMWWCGGVSVVLFCEF